MRLLSDVQLNQYQYRLIDLCSLPPTNECRGGAGGIDYFYNFNLSMAKADTVFSGQLQGDQPPLLDPSQNAFIQLIYLSSENLIYSVAPEITVSLIDEQRTFTLSQLTGTLAFAKPDQFSCYQLQGNTFTQIDLNTERAVCI